MIAKAQLKERYFMLTCDDRIIQMIYEKTHTIAYLTQMGTQAIHLDFTNMMLIIQPSRRDLHMTQKLKYL